MDLRKLKVITEPDLTAAVRNGFEEVQVSENALLTLSAHDYLRSSGLKLFHESTLAQESHAKAAAFSADTNLPFTHHPLLYSPEALDIKEEIIRVGHKLWERQYVDGSGGNISVRLSEQYVICTPALCSKDDLTMDDFTLVDMEGNRVAGTKPPSSEILLHTEIYKAVSQAQAVIHCHPPHAMAFAITGTIPPGCLIPEHEVFVGSVAFAPYETSGTAEFAKAVLPYVRSHNMILLQNHGIVGWADTLKHAQWSVEVIDTYCRTFILASHLNAPLTPIPEQKMQDLLDIRKKLGLPDPRYGIKD